MGKPNPFREAEADVNESLLVLMAALLIGALAFVVSCCHSATHLAALPLIAFRGPLSVLVAILQKLKTPKQ
jgi:hypothetical protein